MKKFLSTKKVSSHRSFSIKPGQRLLIGGVGVFVVAALLLPSVFAFLGSIVLTPIHTVATWLRESPGVLPVYFRDRSQLLKEQELLQARVDEQAGLALTVDRLVQDNIALRSFHGEGQPERLLARVVARPPYIPYDLIQLDKGSSDGVEVGAPVFAGRDIVVGVVVEVGSAYAFVELVTSPSFAATVYVPSVQSFTAMEGVGGGVARVRFPQGIKMSVGDQVVLPAFDGGVYGEITYIESEPTQPEQYGYITMPVSLQSMHYLAVGKKPAEPRTPEAVASSTRALVEQYFLLPTLHQYQLPTSTDPSTTGLVSTTTSSTSPW